MPWELGLNRVMDEECFEAASVEASSLLLPDPTSSKSPRR